MESLLCVGHNRSELTKCELGELSFCVQMKNSTIFSLYIAANRLRVCWLAKNNRKLKDIWAAHDG